MHINSYFRNETLIQSGISGPKSPLRGNILSFEGKRILILTGGILWAYDCIKSDCKRNWALVTKIYLGRIRLL